MSREKPEVRRRTNPRPDQRPVPDWSETRPDLRHSQFFIPHSSLRGCEKIVCWVSLGTSGVGHGFWGSVTTEKAEAPLRAFGKSHSELCQPQGGSPLNSVRHKGWQASYVGGHLEVRGVPSMPPRGPLRNPNGIASSSPGLGQPWAENHVAFPTPIGLCPFCLVT